VIHCSRSGHGGEKSLYHERICSGPRERARLYPAIFFEAVVAGFSVKQVSDLRPKG
jgi:hypothetical protein